MSLHSCYETAYGSHYLVAYGGKKSEQIMKTLFFSKIFSSFISKEKNRFFLVELFPEKKIKMNLVRSVLKF